MYYEYIKISEPSIYYVCGKLNLKANSLFVEDYQF